MATPGKYDPKRKTTYSKPSGNIFKDQAGRTADFNIDALRGILNVQSEFTDAVTGKKAGTSALGSRLFGIPGTKKGGEDKGRPSVTGQAARRNQYNAVSPQQFAEVGGAAAEDPFAELNGKSFADYLAEANAMSDQGGGGPDYGAMESNLRNNASQGSAKLAAMFGALRKSIDADAAPIAQNYDTAQAAVAQNAQQSNAQTQQGFENARAGQTQQMAALGIGEAAGVLAANGGQAARDQAVAQSNIAQNQAANAGQLTANKAAALNYNTGIGNAAGLEGAVQQSALQQALTAKLAELQVAKSADSSQRQSNNSALAFQLADFDNAKAQRRADQLAGPSPMDDLKAQKLAQEVYGQQLKNQNFASNMGGSAGPGLQGYQKLAQQYGVDTSNLEDMMNFVKLYQSSQK